MINESLSELGLNEKEIKLYITLLKHGRNTPTNLSKLSKINRATVYHVAKGLIGKGLIAEDIAGSTVHFIPLPPENLEKTVEDLRREVVNKEKLVTQVISDLSLITSEGKYNVPKIRFIEENNLEKFLYDNASRWNTELLKYDGTWWGFQDHSLVENFEEWILWVGKTKEYKDSRIKAKLLSNDSNIEKKIEGKIPKSKRNTKFVSDMNFTSTIWIVGDYVVMVSTQNHPFYLIEIHDVSLAYNLRETFKKMWTLV